MVPSASAAEAATFIVAGAVVIVPLPGCVSVTVGAWLVEGDKVMEA